jgi:hypothetical protein
LPGARPRQDDPVQDSELDRHEWETEWRELERRLADARAEALPKLDALVAPMLETRGPAADPPAGAVDSEAEIVLQLREVRHVTRRVEASEPVGPGAGFAGTAYRELYHDLLG